MDFNGTSFETIDEIAEDIRHLFESRLITRKEYGELIQKLEKSFRF